MPPRKSGVDEKRHVKRASSRIHGKGEKLMNIPPPAAHNAVTLRGEGGGRDPQIDGNCRQSLWRCRAPMPGSVAGGTHKKD